MSRSPRKILAVVDDPGLLASLRRLLEKEGYVVSSASDGLEGLDKLGLEAPDLVLLDLRLGVPGARSLLKAVGKSRPGQALVITAGDEEARAVEAAMRLESGDSLAKPVDLAALLASVKAKLSSLPDDLPSL